MTQITRKLLAAMLVGLAGALAASPAFAHAFGARYDLPIPLNFFVVGGAATVALSFVVIGLFVRKESDSFDYPRLNLLEVPVLGAVLSSGVFLILIKLLSVALFLLVIAACVLGTSRPLENISPTFVWIIWWVGMGYIVALLGNLWALVNPWKITFEWFEKLAGRDSSHGEAAMFRYSEDWDVWPAMIAFLMFAWLENVYTGATLPFQLGLLILLYSVITWGGMLAFGKHTWLRHGEGFAVLYRFFARFSPTEVRVTDSQLCRACSQSCNEAGEGCVDCYDCFERAGKNQRQLNLRPFAVGLALPERVSAATAAFVILALATVTFDGLQETPAWVNIQTAVFGAAPFLGGNVLGMVDTLGLVLVPLVFLAVYLLFSWGIRQLSGEDAPVTEVAKAFVFSLVPIALAYNLAHFLSLLLIQGQLIIPLASDPFGLGWNIFGTAGYRVNLDVINAQFIWFMSVAAIVLGHVISVYIAHVISLRRVKDSRFALRGQYPMLALMVFYTATSLWIIAQPIVEA